MKKLASLNEDGSINEILHSINAKTDNSEFKNFYNSMNESQPILNTIRDRALSSQDYKSGDLMMSLTSKTVALKERQEKGGHEGRLEEIFVTKYNHAAPVYMDSNKLLRSDVVQVQQSEEVGLLDILESDTFHIDPAKLVDKKYIAKLEQVDYGYKTDLKGQDILDQNGQKIKLNWQEVVKERYQQMSTALHQGMVSAHIQKAEEELHKSKQKKDSLDNNLTSLKERVGPKFVSNLKNSKPIDTTKLEKDIKKTELEINQIASDPGHDEFDLSMAERDLGALQK